MTSPARRPGRSRTERAPRGKLSVLGDATGQRIQPASREDLFPIALGALVLAVVAFIVCNAHGYLLLYGDAVAHLGIARRILDSRYPGISQLGGVWLPLPHLLMLPFVWRMEWWQDGIAGAWPSLACYIVSVLGLYRLARRLMLPLWALMATAFYAFNPNLLYAATTALTESLFLAILVWTVSLTTDCVAAISAGKLPQVRRLLIAMGLLVAAAVYTRYDGWILGAAVWCVLAWHLFKRRDLWSGARLSFAIFTLLSVAAPLGWLAYNQHFYGDPLDFMRGPYSAAAIEKKTSPPGSHHYRGWHNPLWAAVLYTRTAQVVTSAWETGFLLFVLAVAGLLRVARRPLDRPAILLWIPLPFYIYSVAYGSVPIFIPQFYPHSFYNARYGMEMLPAFAIFSVMALEWIQKRLRTSQPLIARLLPPVTFALIPLNTIAMMHSIPLVLKEGIVNASTRVPFEAALARELKSFPEGVPILISTSDHIGALQQAGIPLRQVLSEGDRDSFLEALRAPADHAAYVIAMAGDPVSKAVTARPEGLTELTVLCTTGQSCARVYRSDRFPQASRARIP